MKRAIESNIYEILKPLLNSNTWTATPTRLYAPLNKTYSSGGLGKVYNGHDQLLTDVVRATPSSPQTVNEVLQLASTTQNTGKQALCYALAAKHGDTEALAKLYETLVDQNCDIKLLDPVRKLVNRECQKLMFEVFTHPGKHSLNLTGSLGEDHKTIQTKLCQLEDLQQLQSVVKDLKASRDFKTLLYIYASDSDTQSKNRIPKKDRQNFPHAKKRILHWDAPNFATDLKQYCELVRHLGPMQITLIGHCDLNYKGLSGQASGGSHICTENLSRIFKEALINCTNHFITIRLVACSGGAGSGSLAGNLALTIDPRTKLFVHARLFTSCTLPDGVIATSPESITTEIDNTTAKIKRLYAKQIKPTGVARAHSAISTDNENMRLAFTNLFYKALNGKTEESSSFSDECTDFEKKYANKFPSHDAISLTANLIKLFSINNQTSNTFISRQARSKITYYNQPNLRPYETYNKLYGETTRSVSNGDISVPRALDDRIAELSQQEQNLHDEIVKAMQAVCLSIPSPSHEPLTQTVTDPTLKKAIRLCQALGRQAKAFYSCF